MEFLCVCGFAMFVCGLCVWPLCDILTRRHRHHHHRHHHEHEMCPGSGDGMGAEKGKGQTKGVEQWKKRCEEGRR